MSERISRSQLSFETFDSTSAAARIGDLIAPLYVASHQDVLDNPFYTRERFTERLTGYLQSPGFALVVAFHNTKAIGQAFGYSLPASTEWWTGLTTPVPTGFTNENGKRTFALNELMVIPQRQGRGVAHAVHDQLLRSRQEERATLLVRGNNIAARKAYERWGWVEVAKLQPYPDSPHFDAMILPLPPE